MIRAIVIINNAGKPRVVKFYEHRPEDEQQLFIQEIYELLAKRTDGMCNFLEGGRLWGKDTKIIYRQYATLFFVWVVDSSESELGILDLIQTFVVSLDKCFRNVCELDIVFNCAKVHNLLDEMVQGGLVLETRDAEILDSVFAQKKLETADDKVSQAKQDIKAFFKDVVQ